MVAATLRALPATQISHEIKGAIFFVKWII